MNDLLRSALVGAATGGRTFTGLAALVATASPTATAQPDRTLGRPVAAVPIALLAVAELVLDKLPRTPSRLAPPGLIGRVGVAAACGVIVARRTRRAPHPDQLSGESPSAVEPTTSRGPDPKATAFCALTATAAAVVSAWLGSQCRGVAGRKFGRDWVGAANEDVAVVGLAMIAGR